MGSFIHIYIHPFNNSMSNTVLVVRDIKLKNIQILSSKNACLLHSVLDITSLVCDLNSSIPICVAQCLTCFVEKIFLSLEKGSTNLVLIDQCEIQSFV